MGNKKNIIIAGVIIFVAIIIVAYVFAAKKSAPIYLSKIDKIMFDRKNKSPKYVITMPDKSKREIEKRIVKVIDNEVDSKEEKVSLRTLIENVPSLKKLEPITNISPLRYINLSSDLVENIDGLKVPRAQKMKKAWSEYSREAKTPPNFYKVAIVIRKMGLDENLTSIVYKSFSPDISLSFSPYARNSANQIKEARKHGHETYVDVLLKSDDFRAVDSGPKSINLSDDTEKVVKTLQSIIATDAPVGGVTLNFGVYENEDIQHLGKILDELNYRGMLMLDATDNDNVESQPTEKLARKRADIIIDKTIDKRMIKRQLEKAEEIAREQGQVLIVVTPKPIVLMAIDKWIKSFSPQYSYEEAINLGIDPINLEKPFALVPASAVVVE